MMAGLGVLAFAVYALTLAPGVEPGAPAVATASAMGLLSGLPAAHPLWTLFTRAIAHLPFSNTPVLLNYFSAVCGSVATVLVFRITQRVVFEMISEPPLIRMEPTDEAANSLQDVSEGKTGDVLERTAAMLAGATASILFAFSAPFWNASVALHSQPFMIILTLFVVDRLFCYLYTSKTSACVVCLLLVGIGVVESVVFVLLAPLIFFAILQASIRFQHICESFLLVLMAAGLTGLALNLALALQFSEAVPCFSASGVRQVLSELVHTHLQTLLVGLPRPDLPFIALQTVLPLTVAALAIRQFSTQSDENVQWKWGIASMLFTLLALGYASNISKSAWDLARHGGHLPVIPCLSIAVALGFFLAYWVLMTYEPRFNDEFELAPPSFGLRLLGHGMCMLICVVTLRTFHTNLNDSDGRKSKFADLLAEEVLGQAAHARCLVADGTLDLHVLIKARERGLDLLVLPRAEEDPAATSSDLPYALVLRPAKGSHAPSADAAFQAFLNSHPQAYAQAAILGSPQLWQRSGFTAVPAGLLYLGQPADQKLDMEKLTTSYREWSARIHQVLQDDATLRPDLRRIQTRLRRQASRMANDFGALQESQGLADAAANSYTEALRLDGGNVCALLNRCGVRASSDGGKLDDEGVAELHALAEQLALPGAFDAAIANSGVLAPRPVDALLPALIARSPSLATPDADLCGLFAKWLGCIRAADKSEPAGASATAPATAAAEAAPQLTLAVAMLLEGRETRAENQLRLLLRSQPKNLSAWSLLAEILLNRGETLEVRETVLPAMRKACANDDTTLADMAEGCLCMRESPPDTAQARACFLRAWQQSPNLSVAGEQLLRASMRSGSVANLEADAQAILDQDADHVAANAILGGIRLSQKRYGEAQRFLASSIRSLPTPGARNDLADLLRQTGHRSEAEREARLAIRMKPDFYQAWDTLGNILLEDNRTDEADQVQHCALLWGPSDARVLLTLSRIHLKQGLPQEARKYLDLSRPLLEQTGERTREEYSLLKSRLASYPGPNT